MKFPKMELDPVVNWVGRWLLPMVFYGLGLGLMFGMVRDRISVGWSSQGSADSTTASEEIVYNDTICQTVVQPDGTIIDTCRDVAWTDNINIFEVDGYSFSQFLLPVKFILAVILLAMAYKLTPK